MDEQVSGKIWNYFAAGRDQLRQVGLKAFFSDRVVGQAFLAGVGENDEPLAGQVRIEWRLPLRERR